MGLNKKKVFAVSVIITLCLTAAIVFAEDFSNVPAKGIVTMVDLGAETCIPCKMMAPVMVKLKKIYEGKAAIIFIDVWENKEQSPRFEIRAIPTQIFFDKKGNEVFRHVGFFDEKSIVEQLTKMGVERPDINKKG
jgi:thioredoxin 1